MKAIILGLLISFLCLSAYTQKVFMYGVNGEKIYFLEIDSLVQIKFKRDITNNEQLGILKTINPDIDIPFSKNNRLVIPLNKGKQPNYVDFNKKDFVLYANQTLMSDDGTIQIPTEKVMVKVKNNKELIEILEKLNIEYETYNRLGHDKDSYLITLKNGESLNTANTLYESGYFEYAQPSFTRFIEMMNTYYPNQWGLNNTGQNGGTVGIDINAPEAWQLTTGSSDIVVAVIDQGVDIDHPDLAGNLLTGYDATDGGNGGLNGDCWGNDAHGTCCAGIIGAMDNAIGTIGVAPHCSILPVRISYELNGNEIWDDDWVVDAINYAWEVADADVLSCSWIYSVVAAVTNEINSALSFGRNNLGCVVVFAVGNFNNNVGYPANSNPDIIAVGAMSPCGERKRSSSNWLEVNYGVSTDPNGVSCDNETWWGSNYGSELDLVAPGVFIPTTDIQGTAGYNTSSGTSGNYYLTFNGTSAATPHVAGVAALILSVNPRLSQDQVRDVIESTCRKVGSYNYTTVAGRNNGAWNSQTGYGCVNAYAAVQAAPAHIIGPTNLCSSGSTYSAVNAPPGSYVYWNYSNNITSYYGGNTWKALKAIGNGEGWVEAYIPLSGGDTIHLPRMTVWAGIPTAYNFYTEVNGDEVEYYETALICPNITSCLDAWAEVEEMSTTNYTWHLPSWYSGNGSFGSNGICFNPNGTIGSSITADVTNSCGTGYGVIQIYFGNNGCSRSYQYAISPNPTSTVLTVEQLTTEEAVGRTVLEAAEVYDLSDTKDADDGSYTVEIWHEKKGKVKTVTSKKKEEIIDVSGLEKGYYILHIRTKSAIYKEHLLVK